MKPCFLSTKVTNIFFIHVPSKAIKIYVLAAQKLLAQSSTLFHGDYVSASTAATILQVEALLDDDCTEEDALEAVQLAQKVVRLMCHAISMQLTLIPLAS
jgi:fatty acid-binding protein DegV